MIRTINKNIGLDTMNVDALTRVGRVHELLETVGKEGVDIVAIQETKIK